MVIVGFDDMIYRILNCKASIGILFIMDGPSVPKKPCNLIIAQKNIKESVNHRTKQAWTDGSPSEFHIQKDHPIRLNIG